MIYSGSAEDQNERQGGTHHLYGKGPDCVVILVHGNQTLQTGSLGGLMKQAGRSEEDFPGEGYPMDVAKGRVSVGHIAEIPPGGDRLVRVLGTEVGIYNLGGQFYAVRNYCPHRGAPICLGVRTGTMVPTDEVGRYEWGLEGQVLRCPWHRWEFDIVTGRTLFGLDKRRLICYRVSVENDQIYLHLRPEELRRLLQEGERRPGGGNESYSIASVGDDDGTDD